MNVYKRSIQYIRYVILVLSTVLGTYISTKCLVFYFVVVHRFPQSHKRIEQFIIMRVC